MSGFWNTGRKLNLRELEVSNDILDDRAALEAFWDRNGYWFFRDVFDKGAVGRLRAAYVDELVSLNLVAAGDEEARYNGGDLSVLPKNPVSGTIKGLFDRGPWKNFVDDESTRSFVRRLVGDEPFWVPILGYRVGKPGSDPSAERFEFVHQDGFFNPGIPFLNFWVPLVDMDDEVGGIAIAPGFHKGEYVHDLTQPPAYPVPTSAIQPDAWRKSHYRPGDVLVLHLNTPHTGISNVTRDRFRMSLDVRMLPASGEVPVIGTVTDVSAGHITVRGADAKLSRLIVDDETYCRGNTVTSGNRIPASELPTNYQAGDGVIVAHRQGRATVIRPSSY